MARLIGPRRASGAFYKKRPVTRNPRTRARPMARKASVKLIKQVLNRQLESKYVAFQSPQFKIIGSINPTVSYYAITPPVAIQTGTASNNVREGNVIRPTSARVDVDIWFGNTDDSLTRVVFVKAFFVTSKSVKALPTTVVPNTLPAGLLENGSADPVQWVSSAQALQNYYPVCKDNYTVLKTQVVKLCENQGNPIGGATAGDAPFPDGRSDRKHISFTWKPPALKYDLDTDTFAGNHAPMMFLVAYSPGFDFDATPALAGSVQCQYQTKMSFKDA